MDRRSSATPGTVQANTRSSRQADPDEMAVSSPRPAVRCVHVFAFHVRTVGAWRSSRKPLTAFGRPPLGVVASPPLGRRLSAVQAKSSPPRCRAGEGGRNLMNSVNLIGRLTRDPEKRAIPNKGTEVSV